MTDPFEVFGDAGSDADADTDADQSTEQEKRDPSCGVLSHHEGTEDALLQFVRNQLELELELELEREGKRISPGDITADDSKNTDDNRGDIVIVKKCERILSWIDQFCRDRHWMMHIGDEKGAILEAFLKKRLDVFWSSSVTDGDGVKFGNNGSSSSSSSSSSQPPPFLILEIGTYCGYSAIRMAKTCLQHVQAQKLKQAQTHARCREHDDHFNFFRIVTVDTNPKYVKVAKELIQLAGLQKFVDFVVLSCHNDDDAAAAANKNELLSSTLWKHLTTASTTRATGAAGVGGAGAGAGADFVLMDHDKDWYLSDLLQLERARLIRAKTFVCADNIVFFRLDEYRKHMSDLAKQHVVKTRLELARLEYSSSNTSCCGGDDSPSLWDGSDVAQNETNSFVLDLQDGLELTEYLMDPPLYFP